MLTIDGPRAFSDFRLAHYAHQLAAIGNGHGELGLIDAHYVHFVFVGQPLTTSDTKKMQALLHYGERHRGLSVMQIAERSDADQPDCFITIPRFGTISPWASKATEIFNRCGLSQVKRVERGICWRLNAGVANNQALLDVSQVICDPMTQSLIHAPSQARALLVPAEPAALKIVPILEDGVKALHNANIQLGLALNDDELSYLFDLFNELSRNPTDVELMMFAQANSEHCRHKIFNSRWQIDGETRPSTLFSMIRKTHAASPNRTLSAYSDNAAVLQGMPASRLLVDRHTRAYQLHSEDVHFLAKVETHNHPTAISPHPGAATGSGGEIRDEGATGRGGKPKAGLTGFSVSNLHLPDASRPWELPCAKPARIVSALDIMIEGPLGAAAYNNEFGRPAICGYFRTLEITVPYTSDRHRYGYHKPIMLAGGLGSIRPAHVTKQTFDSGSLIVVLGGPAMLIGLGGGAASSMASGDSTSDLDFASVQRANPELQRRCQEVIDTCVALGNDNPILSIHDVGAGGLSNALPELVHDAGCGAQFELRDVLNDEPSMSPMQLWCNESQERYVLAIAKDSLAQFEAICERERCLYAVIGTSTQDGRLVLHDRDANDQDPAAKYPIDLPLDSVLEPPLNLSREALSVAAKPPALDLSGVSIEEAIERVLSLPAVADKGFLITIGDRTVGGLIHRDPLVGPWQVACADAAVTLSDFTGVSGEAMAVGERTPLAMIDAPASARMALGEALTNLMGCDIDHIDQIRLSANWMAAAGRPGQDAALYAAVEALTGLCLQLGVTIPVGKDSLSMHTRWSDEESQAQSRSVTAPVSVIISAFAPVVDTRRCITPLLDMSNPNTRLMLIDLGGGYNRLGGSALAQVYQQIGDQSPDCEHSQALADVFAWVRTGIRTGAILACHDRSDGGLLACLCEMAFASHCGLDVNLDNVDDDNLRAIFSEELGLVIQVPTTRVDSLKAQFKDVVSQARLIDIGAPIAADRVLFQRGGSVIYQNSRQSLHKLWSDTSFQIQALRDEPSCALAELQRISDDKDQGLNVASAPFDFVAPTVNDRRPRIAVLREQGVNGHIEMAAAFRAAGFDAFDVTMSDVLSGVDDLSGYQALAACGGFSYGDVLGGGQGWAKAILYNDRARDVFATFFARPNTLTLGVCNGCQMLSGLTELVPGSEHWPKFERNLSEQFEARLVCVEITPSDSIWLSGMEGARLPVVVSHGEGKTVFSSTPPSVAAVHIALQYVDGQGEVTQAYPFNPNGAQLATAGLSNQDGRVTIMMPHPERVFRLLQHSWYPARFASDGETQNLGPWSRMFANARYWIEQS